MELLDHFLVIYFFYFDVWLRDLSERRWKNFTGGSFWFCILQMQKIQAWFLMQEFTSGGRTGISGWRIIKKGSTSCGSNFKADIAILIDATDGRPELFQKQKDFAKRILSEKWFPNIGAETRLKVVPYSLTLSKASFILDGWEIPLLRYAKRHRLL